MQAQMLAPAAALIVWSMIMLVWLALTRLPAMKKAGIDMGAAPGGRGQDLEGQLDPKIMWKSHNYAHLMEQPTIFYAAVVILALLGPSALDVTIAWAYVVLRILHSLWQALINTVPVRFSIFMLCNFCMLYLAVRAAMVTLFANPGVI